MRGFCLVPALVWAATAGVTVRQETAIRNACGEEGPGLATVRAGEPVEVRMALAGTGCYKVATASGHEGWVEGDKLEGLEGFELRRRSGRAVRSTDRPPGAGAAAGLTAGAAGPLQEAVRMLERGEPRQALELLETQLTRGARDPQVLALAGLAALDADDARRAADYLRESLAARSNGSVQTLLARAEQELRADGSSEKLHGLWVVLRYEPTLVSSETARRVVAVMDEEYSKINGQLGCRAGETVTAVLQSPEAYRQTTRAAEWSGGQFDGRIRVPYAGADLRAVLAHELTHACLAGLGRWPAWWQEGLAQRMEGRTLSAAQRGRIGAAMRARTQPRLENLGQTFARMSAQHAAFAYDAALAGVSVAFEQLGPDYVRSVLRNPDLLPPLTVDLDRRLMQ
ncbi:MAG: hypothetical protein SFV54_26925 [Bryobacteraceae bacterium]|nr:hypothetical protein [Bryobacteraceae bacterium]